ncbi:sensor histidine kinase [Streptomyces sp. NPDC001500]
MHPPNVWQALSRPGYLLSPWPWRAAAYLLTGAAGGALLLAALAVWAVAGGVLTLVLVGLPLSAALAFAGLPVAALERRRLRWVDPAPAPSAHAEPGAPGVRAWLTARLRGRATWRELAHTLLAAGLLWPAEALVLVVALILPLTMTATPLLLATVGGGREVKVAKLWTVTGQGAAFGSAVLGALLLAAGAYAVGAAAGARAALTRRLVCPRADGPQDQVVELTRSRARLVDAFEAERRRIERDLHDGAQQRLVALSMALGLARLDAPPGTRLAEQLARAHDEAGAVLAELRELIHDIHPKVLADHGLAAALADAADRSPVPVDVECELPRERLPQAVEAAAHFAVREALANVARHSGARRARVRAELHDGRLLALEVEDDGRGGADRARGTGLTGLADRVSVLDGTLSVTSPTGGPTLLRVEIPCEPMPMPKPMPTGKDEGRGEDCASSSPRTASSSATA